MVGRSNHYDERGDMEETVTKLREPICTPMRICYAAVIFLVAVVAPLIVYFAVVSNRAESDDPVTGTCNIKIEYRIACANTTLGVNKDACTNFGCCWNDNNKACFHSVPSKHSYDVENWNNATANTELEKRYLNLKPRRSTCPYDNREAVNLRARVVSTYSGFILRLYLYDSRTSAPVVEDTTPLNSSKFRVQVFGPEYFSVQINRNENGAPLLFSTSIGPKIACDDYWELALQFPRDSALFGLGALRISSKPKLLYNSRHRLGANPFIMILDTEGRAYGILFNNRGPMEFQLLENSNILSVKSRSRVMWDISVFAGPNPAAVMEQYTSIDGLRPTVPPVWALGFHICRDTERKDGTLMADDAMHFLQNAKDKHLPYESDCLQEGLLYGLDFSIPTNMSTIITEFRDTGRKLLFSLPPHVESSLAKPDNLFVWNENGRLEENFLGLDVSYPDFFKEEWQESFCYKISDLEKNTEGILGGFVLQDNWPASTAIQNITEDMAVAEGALSTGTLWWKYLHGNESHYRVHNEYGLRHAKLVASCENENGTLVLSAATHTGVGAVGGCHAHAQANVEATWGNMKTALETALGLGLAGIPLSGGGSVCGTMGDYDEELCVRWYQMSSMLPLMRVSSERPLRDPANLPNEYYRQAAKTALDMRYSLVSYFYFMFHEANSTGIPVARPLFFDFPTDNRTWAIDEQFMIGPALMACPVFYKDTISVPVYIPKENTTWYHFVAGYPVNNGTGGFAVSIPNLKKDMVLLLRGGFIVPYQKAQLTVDKTLPGPYDLVAGLLCGEDGICSARVRLYRDSEYLNFTVTANETAVVIEGSCSECTVGTLWVYGRRFSSMKHTIVSPKIGANCTVKERNGVLEINDLQLDLSNSKNFYMELKLETKEPTTEQRDK